VSIAIVLPITVSHPAGVVFPLVTPTPPVHSGVSARHVQPFFDAQHHSLTCWEAACIVLRQIRITNEDVIWIGHVVRSVLSGRLMTLGEFGRDFGNLDDVG